MSTLYPIGTILPYAGDITTATTQTLISEGYVPCDGRALLLSLPQYKALYGVIGGAYGQDDTQFFVPDYRGRFLRGTDHGAGRDPDAASRTAPNPSATQGGNTGDAVGSIQVDALQEHTHDYTSYHDYHRIDFGGLETPGVLDETTTDATSVAAGGKETRPKNTYVQFVIAYM